MRLLPELTPENTAYWTGGKAGMLLIVHCDECDAPIHPPEILCPHCLSRSVTPRPAVGTGTIYSYTINYQAWLPGLETPFALVVVDLDGEPGVRVTAELKNADPETVAIGQRVRAVFLQQDDVWIPQFVPITGGTL